MADVLTAEQRSRCMAAIRGKDTKPELIVRSLLRGLRVKHATHMRTLPGSPDIVLPRPMIAIFVNGCFWHMHSCRYGRVVAKTNSAFWKKKRSDTVCRDRRARAALRRQGWTVLTVWECQTRQVSKLMSVEGRIRRVVGL